MRGQMRKIRRIRVVTLDEREARKKQDVIKGLIISAALKKYLRQNGKSKGTVKNINRLKHDKPKKVLV